MPTCKIAKMAQPPKNGFPLGELIGDHWDAPVLRGWRLPSRTWNHWTSPWMKELTWLRIVHSGEWCHTFGATHS